MEEVVCKTNALHDAITQFDLVYFDFILEAEDNIPALLVEENAQNHTPVSLAFALLGDQESEENKSILKQVLGKLLRFIQDKLVDSLSEQLLIALNEFESTDIMTILSYKDLYLKLGKIGSDYTNIGFALNMYSAKLNPKQRSLRLFEGVSAEFTDELRAIAKTRSKKDLDALLKQNGMTVESCGKQGESLLYIYRTNPQVFLFLKLSGVQVTKADLDLLAKNPEEKKYFDEFVKMYNTRRPEKDQYLVTAIRFG